MRLALRLLAAAAAFAALEGSVAWAGEFAYSIPSGWRDLRHPPATQNDRYSIPRELLSQASSPRYAAIAVDVGSTTATQVGATFNAVETQSTGHVTPQLARQVGEGIVGELRRAGLTPTLVDADVDKLNGVTVGVITIDARSGRAAPVRMRQYIVPGHKGGTMLTYSAPADDFSRFVPVFEESARGLKGAYDPGVFHWDELFRSGLYGGIAALLIGGVLKYARNRRDVAAAAAGDAPEGEAVPVRAKEPARRATKHLWFCPDCDQPVPIRLDHCRCGGRKPA